MATNITTTFAGSHAAPYISCALFEINSIRNGSLTVKQNIVAKTVVNKGALSASLAAAQCDFTDGSTVTITERILDPKTFEIATKLCKTDFLNDWQVEKMGNSAWKDEPTDAVAWIAPQLLATGMEQLETMIWHGTAGANSIDGFVTLMTADADVVDVAGAAGGVTAANVIDELQKVVDAAPKAVKTKGDFQIVVAFDVFEAYKKALGGFVANIGAQGVNNMGTMWYSGAPGDTLSFDGYAVRTANGLQDGYMVATTVSNLWFGTAMMSDLTFVKTVDTAETLLDNNIRFKAQFVAGVQYGCGTDVVLYTPGA